MSQTILLILSILSSTHPPRLSIQACPLRFLVSQRPNAVIFGFWETTRPPPTCHNPPMRASPAYHPARPLARGAHAPRVRFSAPSRKTRSHRNRSSVRVPIARPQASVSLVPLVLFGSSVHAVHARPFGPFGPFGPFHLRPSKPVKVKSSACRRNPLCPITRHSISLPRRSAAKVGQGKSRIVKVRIFNPLYKPL